MLWARDVIQLVQSLPTWARWCTTVIPDLGSERQEHQKFKVILGYTVDLRST